LITLESRVGTAIIVILLELLGRMARVRPGGLPHSGVEGSPFRGPLGRHRCCGLLLSRRAIRYAAMADDRCRCFALYGDADGPDEAQKFAARQFAVAGVQAELSLQPVAFTSSLTEAWRFRRVPPTAGRCR